MKSIPLDPQKERLVETLVALANPARFRILEILAERPESIVGDIVARLPLAQATVSQHLKVLQGAGLIHDERAGAGTCCRIDHAALSRFARDVVGWALELAAGPTSACVEDDSCTK